MCAINPEVVDFPLVPVTVTKLFFIYLEQYYKKSGHIFKTSIPTNEVPEDLFSNLIPRYAHLAIINDR